MRSFIRHPTDIPIEYQANDDEGAQVARERMNNIGRGGLSFSSLHSLQPGSRITIRITTVQPDFEAKGQVVWCHREGKGFVIGVAFVEEADLFRMRMVEQVCHIEHYKAEVYRQEGRRLDGEQAAREWIQKFADGFPQLEDEPLS